MSRQKPADTVESLKQKMLSSIAAAIIAFGFIIAGVITTAVGSADARILDSTGVTAAGTVVEVEQARLRGRTLSGQFFFRADFVVEGETYQATSSTSFKHRLTAIGDTTEVVYDPENPELNYAGDENTHENTSGGGVALMVFGGALTTVVAVMNLSYLIRLRRLQQ